MALNNEDLAKARAKRDRLAISCGSKLKAAADELTKFLRASNLCYDDSSVTDMDDHRIVLRNEINDFSLYLKGEFDKAKAGELHNGHGFN